LYEAQHGQHEGKSPGCRGRVRRGRHCRWSNGLGSGRFSVNSEVATDPSGGKGCGRRLDHYVDSRLNDYDYSGASDDPGSDEYDRSRSAVFNDHHVSVGRTDWAFNDTPSYAHDGCPNHDYDSGGDDANGGYRHKDRQSNLWACTNGSARNDFDYGTPQAIHNRLERADRQESVGVLRCYPAGRHLVVRPEGV
jgi:hypothetical protein